jgi:hypothetical protein
MDEEISRAFSSSVTHSRAAFRLYALREGFLCRMAFLLGKPMRNTLILQTILCKTR